MDKVVVDDWGQARDGPLRRAARHVDAGLLTPRRLHAELGQIVAGDAPGPRDATTRRSCSGTAGCSLTDIALGHAMLEKARALGVGQTAPLPLRQRSRGRDLTFA